MWKIDFWVNKSDHVNLRLFNLELSEMNPRVIRLGSFFSLFFISLLPVAGNGIELEPSYENSNIISFEEVEGVQVLNRFRLQGVVSSEKMTAMSGVLILDNNTFYVHDTSYLENQLKVYRAYLEYAGDKHFITVGKQRVPLGVGRIWNPVDVFNPIDSFSVEPEEREGTIALRYEYALNEVSNFDVTFSQDKGAARLKSYLGGADLALLGVVDFDNQLDIVGWEIAGELPGTGIELRSEGGTFHDQETGNRHLELIVGGEYGFVNSLSLLGEYFYNGETKSSYLGLTGSYTVSMLLSVQLFAVMNFSDYSRGIIPSFTYSLGDDMTLAGSVFLYQGDFGEEYGDLANQYVLRWFVNL